MRDAPGVVLAVVVAILAGMVVGLVAGILVWIRGSSLPASERAAGAILQGGAAWGGAILLVLAIFGAVGVLH